MNSICSTKDFPESDKEALLCPTVLFKCQVSACILLLFFLVPHQSACSHFPVMMVALQKLYWKSFVIN